MDQVAGDDVPERDSKPVRTKLWDRAASAARVMGGLAQALYYVLKSLKVIP
ncbi:hypothetical protein ACWF95_34070 [Streptomyces vinaceus]